MEARRTFARSSMSKGLIAVVAVCAAAGLGAGSALVVKNLTGSGAAVNSSSYAEPQAMPLRQDNDYPVLANSGASFIQTHTGRRGGTIDDSTSGAGFVADGNGPDSDLTRALPTAAPERLTGHRELP